MYSRFGTLLVLLLGLLLFTGCADPNAARKQLLLGEIKQLESTYALQSQALLQAEQSAGLIAQRLGQREAESADLDRRVTAYLMNHKMAAAAIAAGAGGTVLATDSSGAYSDEIRVAAGLAAGIALLWAMNNMEEVMAVASNLAAAEQSSKALKAAINQDRQALRVAQQQAASVRQQLAGIDGRYQQLRSNFAALK